MIRNKDAVDFDPANPEHVLAIKSLLDTGKLHPTLRFHLDPEMTPDEEGRKSPRYTSVLSMALFKMAMAHMDSMQEKVGVPNEEDISLPVSGGVVRQLPVKQHSNTGQQAKVPFGDRVQGDLVAEVKDAKTFH